MKGSNANGSKSNASRPKFCGSDRLSKPRSAPCRNVSRNAPNYRNNWPKPQKSMPRSRNGRKISKLSKPMSSNPPAPRNCRRSGSRHYARLRPNRPGWKLSCSNYRPARKTRPRCASIWPPASKTSRSCSKTRHN
ncbi:hypothetical protein SDC9_202870 [bioreactor metagenome]|uniref:Uncharacterized protein n=1 Tax=bioreactor metagenome TaxID=1076179 RepID=A0A645IUU9_9ZZZZ